MPPVPWKEENYEAKQLLRSVISANQLSIYGAIADLCDEVPNRIRAPVKPAAPEHLEKVEIPTALFKAENSTNEQQWRNLRQEFVRKFEQLSDDQKLSKLCSDAGLTSSNFAKILPNSNSLPDCNAYQNNRDVTSILGYVVNKNRSLGAKQGASERQKMYYRAKQMLKKARQGKHGGHPTIFSRRYACDECRKSLSDIGLREHHLIFTTGSPWRTASTKLRGLKEFSYRKNWILTANVEGGT